jgi:hypothetical protein
VEKARAALANETADSGLSIVPVKQFVRDLPFAIAFQQRENIGSTRIGSGQFAGPTFYLEMHDGNTLDDLNTCKAGIDIRRRAGPRPKLAISRPSTGSDLRPSGA